MAKVCLCCSFATFSSIAAICSSLLFFRARRMASSSVIEDVCPLTLGEKVISRVPMPTLIVRKVAFLIIVFVVSYSEKVFGTEMFVL